MNIFQQLGLGWPDILFHAITLIILIVALRFLLFKPIKKIIDKRKEEIQAIEIDRKTVDEQKQGIESMITSAQKEASAIKETAQKEAVERSNAVVENAQKEAKKIIDTSLLEAKAEKKRLSIELKSEVEDLAVEIAQELIERELSTKDNSKIIEKHLSKWE